jgi:L-ascorbate metabolism protein UlaG (beta-lactamase superfamily)
MPEPARLTYIGHATTLIELDGARLLTDPLLRARTAHLRRRPRRIDPAWLRDIDAILLSHLHLDHFDLPSLRRLGLAVPILAPQGAGPLLRRHGFRAIRELGVGAAATVGPLEVTATYAAHAGRRPPLGPTAEALGFLVRGGRRIYFAGDTDLFPGMADLGADLDAALLPVWGWGPRLGSGHLDPGRAAEALRLLRPRLALPIHWGTFHPIGLGGKRRFLTDPPHAFARHAARLAPEVRVAIAAPGESVTFE